MFDMRKLKCLMFVAAVALALVGCRKQVEVSFADTTVEVEAQGGTVEVNLKSNGEWAIDAMPDWISVSPVSGTGDATLTLTAQPNTAAESRKGEVKATTKDNTAVLTVEQGIGTFLNIAPASIECTEAGGEFDIAVAANVAWTVTGLPDWMTCSPAEGSGSATVVVTVLAVSGDFGASRTADVVVGNAELNATLHVLQTVAQPATISVTPNTLEIACEGESKTVEVTCDDAWTASANEDWVTLDKTQADGDAIVTVTVGENPHYVPRNAIVVFTTTAGLQTLLTVKQEPSPDPHFLDVSPLSFNFGKQGGSQELVVGCDTDWEMGLDCEWMSASAMSGNGTATVTLTAEPNPINEARSMAFWVVSGNLIQRVTVTQEAGDEPLWVVLSPDTLSVSYTGAISAELDVTSNTTWILEASSWIMNLPEQMTQGDATVYLIIDQNSSAEPRYGFVRALHGGEVMAEMVVAQEGKPDLLETDITELEMREEGGEVVIHVTSNQSWIATCDVEWMSCTPDSGFANADITLTVQPMATLHPRTGHLNLKAASGRIVTVTVNQQH